MWEDLSFSDLEFRGIGVEGARFWAARVEPTNGFGLRLDLGYLRSAWRISPSTRFWSSTLLADEVMRLADQIVLVCERQVDALCPDRLDLGEVNLSDLELAIDGQYLLNPARAVAPYVGIALALHLLNGRGDFIDDTFVEDLLDSIAPGLGAFTGLNVQLGSALRLTIEARFMLASEIRYASFGFGGVWALPTPRDVTGQSRRESQR